MTSHYYSIPFDFLYRVFNVEKYGRRSIYFTYQTKAKVFPGDIIIRGTALDSSILGELFK